MTTTGSFTDAAHEAAREQFPDPFYRTAWSEAEVRAKRALWESGAEWAHDHLTAQGPTDVEVRAAKIALIQAEYRVVPGNELVMIRQMGREDEYDQRARAALSAARTAR